MPDLPGERIVLVTGANKGIGYEIARQLGRLGAVVHLGARDERRGRQAAARLAAEGLTAQALHLDVTDGATLMRAARRLGERHGRLDVLVNNAGITGAFGGPPSAATAGQLREVYDTNVFGVLAVTNAMLPLLRRSTSPRIVNVSSSVASLTRQADPDIQIGPVMAAYAPSKSFLNAVTVQYARQLADTDILINAACPGLVATDFTGFQGPRTPQQGAATAIRLATLSDGGPTGSFFEDAGVVPW